MEPDCTGAEPAAATSFLNTIFDQVRDGGVTGNITTAGQQAECVAEVLVQQPNASAINRQLYCGFYQARLRPLIMVVSAWLNDELPFFNTDICALRLAKLTMSVSL